MGLPNYEQTGQSMSYAQTSEGKGIIIMKQKHGTPQGRIIIGNGGNQYLYRPLTRGEGVGKKLPRHKLGATKKRNPSRKKKK